MLHFAFIALGTNLCGSQNNNRQQQLSQNLETALRALQKQVGKLLKCSSFLKTEPWGFKSDNSFLNAVALFQTSLTPTELLTATQHIELQMGRTSKSHDHQYHDRIIDIDILFYDDVCLQSTELTLPHPQIEQRDFVLKPLAEIAPDYIHPTLHKTILQLLQELQMAWS